MFSMNIVWYGKEIHFTKEKWLKQDQELHVVPPNDALQKSRQYS